MYRSCYYHLELPSTAWMGDDGTSVHNVCSLMIVGSSSPTPVKQETNSNLADVLRNLKKNDKALYHQRLHKVIIQYHESAIFE